MITGWPDRECWCVRMHEALVFDEVLRSLVRRDAMMYPPEVIVVVLRAL